MQPGFQSLKQQLYLPAKSIPFHDSKRRDLLTRERRQYPDDFAFSSPGRHDPCRNPGDGLRQTPAFVGLGPLCRGNWNNNIEFDCPGFGNLSLLFEDEDSFSIQAADPQGVRVQSGYNLSLRRAHRVNTARCCIGTVSQDDLPRHDRMQCLSFTTTVVGQFDGLEAASGWMDQNMGAPFSTGRPWTDNHRGIDYSQVQTRRTLAYLALQRLGQNPLQPSFGLSQPIKQAWPGNLGHLQRTRPCGYVLQGKIRYRLCQRHSDKRYGIGNIAASNQRLGLPRRILQIVRKKGQHIRPLSVVVNGWGSHDPRLPQRKSQGNPYFNAYGVPPSPPAPLPRWGEGNRS